MSVQRLVFGLVVPSAGSGLGVHVDALTKAISDRLGIPVARRDAASYEALASDVKEGRTDLAWLPPIVFVRLGDIVTSVASIMRGGSASFEAALIVRESSKIVSLDGLRGTRAGWVDRWSSSGFVLPRVNLALEGLDPRTLFRSETFHGSHRSAIKALVEGHCDVAGTYAHADAMGELTVGGWSSVDGADVRVLATFGAIPPDVIALRSVIADRLHDRVLAALTSIEGESPSLLGRVFDGDDLRRGLAPGYDALRRALDMATARGIFDEA